MRIPIIMTIAIMSFASNVTHSQEEPTTEKLIEQTTISEQTAPEQEQIVLQEESTKEESPAQEVVEQESSPEDSPTEETVAPIAETTDTTPITTESTTVTIPTEPEPIKDEPVVIPEEETELEAPMGIDTVSLDNPQGNWLFKKIWWERAEERYEKIRQLVDSIWESRTTFFVKRNELDRNVLDPFYLTVGIGQGELQTILAELVDFFEKNREQQGDLNEQERALYETIAPQEEALKQLKLDIESIANLDHSIDDALGTLMNQINRVRQFERQAWENFKEIAHILNDTKARELYYMIEGAARNIKNISSYLERDFLSHFNKLTGEATKHVTRVQNQIEALKEQGVNFKRQTELLATQQETQEDEDDADNDEDIAPKPKLGWFGWILSGFKSGLNLIFSIISIPYNMIFGK